MKFLRQNGFDSVIKKHNKNGGKIFGICSGMQVLFESSSENNYVQCLGIIPGKVTKIESKTQKVPNLGWDTISDEKYYFMHSYGVNIRSTNANFNAIRTIPKFPNFIASGKISNIAFCQFHPENPHFTGLNSSKAPAMRIIPKISVFGDVAYTTKTHRKSMYVGCPINAAKIFNDLGCQELIINFIGEDKCIETAKKCLINLNVPVTVGGFTKNY